MHSRLLSRILVVAGCVLILGVAVLMGTQLRISDTGWEAMVRAIAGGGWQDSQAITLALDSVPTDTEEISLTLQGSAASPNGAVGVTAYRCNDVGEIQPEDAVGELGDLRSAYPATLEGSRFTTADIHLIDGDNFFLVVATDSTGQAAKQLVRVRYSLGVVKPVDLNAVAVTEDGVHYVGNQLILTFKPDVTMDRARAVIAEIGGTEVGVINVLKRFQVEVPSMGYDDLKAMAERCQQQYTELLSAAPDLVDYTGGSQAVAEAEHTPLPGVLPALTGELAPAVTAAASAPAAAAAAATPAPTAPLPAPETPADLPDDPWSDTPADGPAAWDESLPGGSNWNLEAIEAPSAWEYLPYFRSFTVAVIDIGFVDGHDDLRLFYTDSRRVEDSHGAHIAGTIGATQNNGVGIAGVMNKGRVLAYPLAAQALEDGTYVSGSTEKLMALVACVTNGASVISCSLAQADVAQDNDAAAKEYRLSECAELSETMAALLSQGYDFVVAQSAGNGDENGNPVDSVNAGWFAYVRAMDDPAMADMAAALQQHYGVTVADLTDRVLVVANAENTSQGSPSFQLQASSNCGDHVDIAAPGTDIYSTVPGGMLGMGAYGTMTGTSMAAPHVAAVAAMAWSTNLDLTGGDLKKILVENYRYRVASPAGSSMPGYEYPMVDALLAVKAALAFERVNTQVQLSTVDAATGSPLSAGVEIHRGVEPGGPLMGTYTTDASGALQLDLDSGDYLLRIYRDGYIELPSVALHVDAQTTNSATYALSRELGENEFRIVLTWGATPSDLDSHLSGRDSEGTAVHVYYSSKTHYTGSAVYTELDVDDTSSFGPETITLYQLPTTPLVYSVHDYTNGFSGNNLYLSNSGATVQVMRGSELLKTYTVSPNHNAVVWDVFRILPDGTIEDIDAYSTGPVYAENVGAEYR